MAKIFTSDLQELKEIGDDDVVIHQIAVLFDPDFMTNFGVCHQQFLKEIKDAVKRINDYLAFHPQKFKPEFIDHLSVTFDRVSLEMFDKDFVFDVLGQYIFDESLPTPLRVKCDYSSDRVERLRNHRSKVACQTSGTMEPRRC